MERRIARRVNGRPYTQSVSPRLRPVESLCDVPGQAGTHGRCETSHYGHIGRCTGCVEVVGAISAAEVTQHA